MLQTILQNLAKSIFSKIKADLVPVGAIISVPFGHNPGSKYLLCDGSQHSISSYPYLSAICANLPIMESDPLQEGNFRVPNIQGDMQHQYYIKKDFISYY
jgi:hypothetical protein